MSDDKPKTSPKIRLASLDVAVGLISVVLIAGVLALTYISDPQNKSATVAYLYPAYGGIQNVWMTSLDDTETMQQITFSDDGVYDFDVSPDGRYLAYAERRRPDTDIANYLMEIMLLDLRTGETTQLTNCIAEDADCRSPKFRSGNDIISYERMALNSDIAQVGPGSVRIWLLDIRQQPYETTPLAPDPQFVGYGVQWADNGQALAFYSPDIASPGIMVYNFAPADGEKTLKYIPSNQGVTGTLSPNGKRLVFPEITSLPNTSGAAEVTQSYHSYLRIADLNTLEFVPLTDPEGFADDSNARWHPDGQRLAVERRYLDERYTRGYQIFMLDVATGETEPLVFDDDYSHGFFEWNNAGDKLALQRFNLTEGAEAKPGIWVKDLESGALVEVAANAFHPRWVIP